MTQQIRSFDADWGTPTYARPARDEAAPVTAARSTRSPSEPRGVTTPAGRNGLRTSSAPRVPFAVLLVGMLVAGTALLLLLNTASAANELNQHDLANSDASVGAQVQQLRNEVAASAAPANLARAALGLGMVPASNPAFLVVLPGGRIVVRGSAAPASAIPVAVPPAAKKPTAKKTAESAVKKAAAKKGAATSPAKKPTTSTSAATKSTTRAPASTTKTAKRSASRKSPSPTPTSTGAHR